MIFKNLTFLEEIVKKNDIKSALKLIKSPKKFSLPITQKKSALMVSGHNVKHLNKIDELEADVIILNLEDGVVEEKKEIAKVMIAVFLSHLEKLDKEIIVRINPLEKNGLKEIEFLDRFSFNGFRIPKINNIKEIDVVLNKTNKEIHLSIETKKSFFNLKEFSYKRVSTFYIGIYDLLNELNLSHSIIDINNPLIHKILSDFSLTTLYLEKTPIGFVYQKYKDLDGFFKWCLLQKNLGFKGVGCITPSQVKIANQIFSEDLEFAKLIVSRFEKEGAFTINGLYVDEPIYKNYLRLLQNL